MPAPLSISLAVVVVLFVVLRLVFGRGSFAITRTPLTRIARPITVVDAIVVAFATLGLALHCGAMFYRPIVSAIPGTDGVVGLINAMGTPSLILYVTPAILLLIGLRHQNPAAMVILTLTLVAVGVTMYNGAPTSVHLMTIYASVTVLAAIIVLLISRVTVRRAMVA